MTIHKNPLVKPFVKWAGGKRQLLPEIKRYLPSKIKDYYEPFVGGGAVFLDIQCPHPVINDFNDELINTYLVVRDDVDSLIHLLKKHELNNSSDYYYQMRAWDRTGELQKRSNTERAARFIYLNKTGFNGLFRVNSQGQINVPYGRYKNPAIVNEEVLHAVSLYNVLLVTILTFYIVSDKVLEHVKDRLKSKYGKLKVTICRFPLFLVGSHFSMVS